MNACHIAHHTHVMQCTARLPHGTNVRNHTTSAAHKTSCDPLNPLICHSQEPLNCHPQVPLTRMLLTILRLTMCHSQDIAQAARMQHMLHITSWQAATAHARTCTCTRHDHRCIAADNRPVTTVPTTQQAVTQTTCTTHHPCPQAQAPNTRVAWSPTTVLYIDRSLYMHNCMCQLASCQLHTAVGDRLTHPQQCMHAVMHATA